MEENPNEISILDILELAHSLRQEKLSIETEMNDYFRLQMKLGENSFEAIKTAWISSLHRQNLNSLILSKPENRPSLCCQRATLLENVEFVEAHKDPGIKYQNLPLYVDLLRFIHQSPTVLANCLAIGDDLPQLGLAAASSKAEQMNQIAQIISAGLYGNSIHGKDVEMMLKLLEKLLELKVATCEIPRRLLRLSSSSFARLYHKFHESSLSSKLFLTAALHEPVMSVLIDDNSMLDETDEALFTLSSKFVSSLSRNWIIFPSTIRWLVQTMSKLLHAKNFDPATINEILIDMVFGHFICPACVSPDLYGISDAPISENARHNLIQIGQILQMLALARPQDVENKFSTIFRRFDENIISNLMEQLLENTYDISEMGLSHQLPTLYNIGRSSILMTHVEISLLVQFLKATVDDNEKLKSMVDVLPVLIEPVARSNGVIDTSPSKRSSKLLGKNSRKIVKNLSEENEDSLDRVLIIPLSIYDNNNKIRPLSEDEVLNMNQVTISDSAASLTEKNVEMIEPESKEKRFADDASIDNLELEAVSEAPSNHSVASSLDLEENNDNDNLSDMVSANVSGRGTPNISGRDTPSSQVIDGADAPQIPTPQMAKILNKARNDIEDKFCKFEIKKLLEGDETISIISDTWSTDVLASDSETIEASERNFSTPLIPSNFTFRNLDISETQSESAWSTDVLIASDSEKNDNDSRSDITETRDQVPYIHFRPIDPGPRPQTSRSATFNYLQQPRPLRQHSNESQSSTGCDPPKLKEFMDSPQALSVFRDNSSNSLNSSTSPVIKTSVNLINPFASRMCQPPEAEVETRRLSDEQRSVSYDSRRNGMIDLLSSPAVNSANPFEASLTDDVKQQQMTKANSIDENELSAKVENLKLVEPAPSTSKVANGSVKNGKSTGAIPKSISFDSTADKVERNHNRRSELAKVQQQNQSQGFLSKIRQGFKSRRSGKGRHSTDETFCGDLLTNGSPMRALNLAGFVAEDMTSDDILAKYRRKPSSSSDAATSDSTGSNNSSSLKSKSSDNENRLSSAHHDPETDLFMNAKRKLRLVLSTSDCHACDVRNNSQASTLSPLLSYLQMQLAQAMNQQNLQQVSYVSELLRCLHALDTAAHYKLIEELQKDLQQRQSYLQYLVRLRQDLLSTIATIDNFQSRLQNDRAMCNRHLVMVCVRMFLEKREAMINAFQEDFNAKPAADEKLELMEELIVSLMEDLKNDSIVQGMAEWQLVEARNCIERILLQRLYHQVMFPNDDVDISNDRLLHNCIKKLSRFITPSHAGLRIPHRYLNEAPWPLAQQQISYISAYKTPQEKVQCVIRCIQSIMHLLRMASNQQPAADDLVPVLIYVIIKANPPFLMSTINYVECFIGMKLKGEELYWWTQFSSAIQFIKTMIERMEKTGQENCE